jgi:UMF1 family MFS transporter
MSPTTPPSTGALQTGVKRRHVWAWAMYDFANSGYTTVVITAVFSAYFVGAVAGAAPWATLAWTVALSVSYALALLVMPALGAWADGRGSKKRVLLWSTLGCVLATAALATVGAQDVALAMALIVVSNLLYSVGESTIAAFLPELAKPESMGRVSGWGWAWGYVGGMVTLGLCLAYVLSAQARGEPATAFVPVTMLITAAVFGLAACVTLLGLPERANPPAATTAHATRQWWAQLRATWAHAQTLPDLAQSLRCVVAYQAGVAVAIALAAIYAEQTMGFAPQETMVLIFVLNIAAMAGALLLGHLHDRIGVKATLGLTLVGWVLTCAIAALAQSKGVFWWAAGIAGVCMGASQSAGRAMVGQLSPPAQRGEFFALWGVAVRVASILGPLLYGVVTWLASGNQRLAIAATSVLFVLGWWLLRGVNVARGMRAVASSSAP